MVKYLKNDSIISEAVGLQEQDDVMLFDQSSENVYIVNYTAFLVFEELSVEKSIFDLIEIMRNKYQVERDILANDIQKILDLFVEKKIIVKREYD